MPKFTLLPVLVLSVMATFVRARALVMVRVGVPFPVSPLVLVPVKLLEEEKT